MPEAAEAWGPYGTQARSAHGVSRVWGDPDLPFLRWPRTTLTSHPARVTQEPAWPCLPSVVQASGPPWSPHSFSSGPQDAPASLPQEMTSGPTSPRKQCCLEGTPWLPGRPWLRAYLPPHPSSQLPSCLRGGAWPRPPVHLGPGPSPATAPPTPGSHSVVYLASTPLLESPPTLLVLSPQCLYKTGSSCSVLFC